MFFFFSQRVHYSCWDYDTGNIVFFSSSQIANTLCVCDNKQNNLNRSFNYDNQNKHNNKNNNDNPTIAMLIILIKIMITIVITIIKIYTMIIVVISIIIFLMLTIILILATILPLFQMMMMMLMMMVIVIIIIIITPRDQEILGWCPAGHSLISWGEGSFLALVGNPSRDGVLIKILVWRHLKPNSQLLWLNYV